VIYRRKKTITDRHIITEILLKVALNSIEATYNTLKTLNPKYLKQLNPFKYLKINLKQIKILNNVI
jgi:hypothetical protein